VGNSFFLPAASISHTSTLNAEHGQLSIAAARMTAVRSGGKIEFRDADSRLYQVVLYAEADGAEADGNRTRRRRGAPSTGFEDWGGHQAPGRLQR